MLIITYVFCPYDHNIVFTGLCQVSGIGVGGGIGDKYYACRYGDPECLLYLWAEGLHVAYVPVYNTGSLSWRLGCY